MARFRGSDNINGFIDSQIFSGNILEILEKTDEFFSKHMPISGDLVPYQMQRVEKLPVPYLAFREAMVNVVAHSDYTALGILLEWPFLMIALRFLTMEL